MFSQKIKEELRKLKHDRVLMLGAIQRLELLLEGPDPVLDSEDYKRYGDELDHLEDDMEKSLRVDSKRAFEGAFRKIQSGMDDEYLYRILAEQARTILRHQRRKYLRKNQRFPLRTLLGIIF